MEYIFLALRKWKNGKGKDKKRSLIWEIHAENLETALAKFWKQIWEYSKDRNDSRIIIYMIFSRNKDFLVIEEMSSLVYGLLCTTTTNAKSKTVKELEKEYEIRST